uniref:Arrestin domain containing 2 n=1 Tax=Cyprinus carpio carpio TaxID=630221 RepID=A0A9J7YDY8_CYPCA
MLRSRISNVPFLDGADDMYATSNKSHFKLVDATVKSKREVVLQPVSSLFKRGDQKYLAEYQTETALSFPSHPPAPVVQPNLTHLNMQRTNFKLHSGDRCGDYEITQSELKPLPMCAAKIIRPTTTVRTSLPEDKYPEPTYRSSYIKHKVSRIFRAKQSAKTGVGSSLIMDRRDRFRSSYHEQFQYRWYPRPPETEKQQIQYSSVVMGDREKTVDKQTTYSTSFGQSGDHSSAEFKECLLPKINKSRPINLREVPDDKWTTNSSEEFRAHKCGPVHFERRCPTLSSVFKGETLTGDQQRLSTTNQFFFPKINGSQFPVHVDGASIRTLSSVEFGRPDLAGSFYSTATQEQFPPKEVVPPKPPIYPPSHVLSEQEPDWMLTTMKKDFVPLNCKRQKMSPSQLQQVKDSHIRPQHSKHDFRTIHNEAFVPKPYCKASLEKPPLQHISHVPF